MRWDLDLDGDGQVGGRSDACVVLRPVKGRRVLRAELYRGCTGDSVATSDSRPSGNSLVVRLLLAEVREAGLGQDAAGYAYRFRAMTSNGASDDVPDEPGALIEHMLGASEGSTQPRSDTSETRSGSGSSEDVVVGQASETQATGEPGDTATAAAKQEGEKQDTTGAGTAKDAVVEPGDDVEIQASGFARNQQLQISLAGAQTATSTATQSPSPSPSSTASPAASPTSTPAGAQNATAQDVSAQAVSAKSIGVAMSDQEGNLDDDVDIPEETTPGDYRILAQGRNATGGTHTVSIPIKVAADVESGSTDDATDGGQVTNATGTATQAPSAAPVAAGTTGTALPKTGSSHLPLMAGLGTVGVLLGGSMVFARRRLGTTGGVTAAAGAAAGPVPPANSGLPAAASGLAGLRGEMQRLLALRSDRNDPDRDADL